MFRGKKLKAAGLVSALGLLALGTAAQAQTTQTAGFSVVVNVVQTCTISTSTATINFGPLPTGPVADIDLDNAMTITVDCGTAGETYDLQLPYSANANAGQRRMYDGSSLYIGYNLYEGATVAGGTLWDDTTMAAETTGVGGITTYNVSARMLGDPNGYTSGAYADTVVATITF